MNFSSQGSQQTSRLASLAFVDEVFYWPQAAEWFLKWLNKPSVQYNPNQQHDPNRLINISGNQEAFYYALGKNDTKQIKEYYERMEASLSSLNPNDRYLIQSSLPIFMLLGKHDLAARYLNEFKQTQNNTNQVVPYEKIFGLLSDSDKQQLHLQLWPVSHDPDSGLEVSWEFSPIHDSGRETFGFPLPKLQGKYDLTITVHARSGSPALETFNFYSVPSRGKISIPTRLAGGFIRASVQSDNLQVTISPSKTVLFSTTPNLLPELIPVVDQQQNILRLPGWKLPSIMPFTAQYGGPTHQSPYTRFSTLFTSRSVSLRSEPIAYSPQQSFLFSCWINGGGVNLSFLDHNGKVLRTQSFHSDSQIWQNHSIIVGHYRREANSPIQTQTPPPQTAFIQVNIFGSTPLNIARLTLQELSLP